MAEAPKRILVAEDNPALLSVIRFNLERADFVVSVAKNGSSAWQQIQKEPFDLLVTDAQMPGICGIELCRRIRQLPEYRELPVIFLTAKSFEMDQQSLKQNLNVHAVIPKPFSPSAVVQIVEELLAVV